MKFWTEVKCYACSRVCGEAPGRGERLDRLRELKRMLPGAFCALAEGQLRCSRCGGLVYPGETYSSYEIKHSDPPVQRRYMSPKVRSTASRVA